ncbi:hypothetical protein HGRIS_006169 [Hohenbuehelia grisea]
MLSEVHSQTDETAGADFRNLLDIASTNLSQLHENSPLTVIVDELSLLSWLGISPSEIARFCRALRAVCLKSKANLIIRHHIVTPGEPDDLFRRIFQLCSYHLDDKPLASGKSGSVSGEVALHSGPNAPLKGTRVFSRSSALQYRLTETGVIFFERGTSSGVL